MNGMSRMVRNILRGVIACGGLLGGYFLVRLMTMLILPFGAWKEERYLLCAIIACVVILICGFIAFLLSSFIIDFVIKACRKVANFISGLSARELLGGTVGLIAGLVIANLLGASISKLAFGPYIVLAFSLCMGYIGLIVGVKRSDDAVSVLGGFSGKKATREKRQKALEGLSFLDTSAIIDGRIVDVYRTGFIQGPLVVPDFILDELKRVADSNDPLKKARGRRGMELLKGLREEDANAIIVTEKDFEDVKEVDMKLVHLAVAMKGRVVTNDMNLNKLAQVQGVQVLNINDLANAVKTVLLPGEEITLRVVKEGKEHDQGIAYLDDGTMVVVESGKYHVGVTLTVVVTSVLQTSAGRMIFARPIE